MFLICVNIVFSLLVVFIFIIFDEVLGILNCIVKLGRVFEGFSFMGSRGIKVRLINVMYIKVIISVKEEVFVCVFILEGLFIVLMLVSIIVLIVFLYS